METVLNTHRSAFLGFLRRRLNNPQEAEDVLHDFYLRAISKADQLRSRETMVAWLYRVLRTTLADHQRSSARRYRSETGHARDAILTQGIDEDLYSEVCNCLRDLLPALRPDQADLIWRLDLLGQARGDVAADLGLRPNALGVRLHRARSALKDALLASCATCPVHGFDDCGCARGATPGSLTEIQFRLRIMV